MFHQMVYKKSRGNSRDSWDPEESSQRFPATSIPYRVTHKHMQTLSPKGNLDRPINLTHTLLDYGTKQQYPEKTHACTERSCSKQKDLCAEIQTKDFLAGRHCRCSESSVSST
ncbi:hypothetical protein GOODEAATRI_030603 [Goodea atripinnis]|uniref:Uncharacterized protein n=1 Tax=Goodea atripinnis TaxID=208336 RepID=A0ABV0NF06_9TELE